MDVRKVQSVVKEIYAGGKIKVSITEDLDDLKNGDKIIAIGSNKTISYQYQSSSEMMANYFKILDESNKQILTLIDKYIIQNAQYFPIYAFSKINDSIDSSEKLKQLQSNNLSNAITGLTGSCRKTHTTIDNIFSDNDISNTNKDLAVLYNIMQENLDLAIVEEYLRNYEDKKSTNYRKILCAYDLIKYK